MKRLLPFLVAVGLVAPAAARAATYYIQPILVCPESDPLCGFASAAEFDAKFRVSVDEINLEYRQSGISYAPLPVQNIADDDFDLITGQASASDKDANAKRIEDLVAGYAADNPEVITFFLKDGLGRCWNGLACPGEGDEFDQDEVVFCAPPRNATRAGRTYAHELGHFWCLRHTMTFEDAATNDPVDRDHDDLIRASGNSVCESLTGVWDTDADPGPFEKWSKAKSKSADQNASWQERDGHEWCDTLDYKDTDAGSPHAWRCDPLCIQREDGHDHLSGETPPTEDAMTYYPSGYCRGPYSFEGEPHEAFTQGQIDEMYECLAEVPLRSQLVDACADLGGDIDNDGFCQKEDKCPFEWNSSKDTDGDGIPDACDTCKKTPNAKDGDDDHDGIGNACDKDWDNDGCKNGVDQHPHDKLIPVGEANGPNCPHPEVIYEDESEDIDGDGVRNCRDADDDGDLQDDAVDACVISPDEGDCHPFSLEICDEIFAQLCRIGDCGWLEILVDPGYPDPTQVWTFGDLEQVGDTLYVEPLAGRSIGESARILAGELDLVGTQPMRRAALRIVTKAGREPVARPFEFEPGDGRVRLGEFTTGKLLRVEQTRDGLRIDAVWAVGDAPGRRYEDEDGDGVPDFADACTRVPDAGQLDGDGDGYGDACDADLDDDGVVSERDLDRVGACLGVDLAARYAPETCEPEAIVEDASAEALQEACEPVDFDANRRIDERDYDVVKQRMGLAPGPSGLVEGERR